MVDDISGHVAGTPKMVQVLTAEAARLLVEGFQARDLPLSKGKSKALIDGPDKAKHALLQQLEALGIDESKSARNVGADLQLGRRRRALVVKGRLARASKQTKRVRQLRKAGAHTGKLTLTGSNAGVLWGSEVLGFTPTQLQSIRVDAAKATYRLSRGQNAATTMLANAQAAGAKNIDPAFRHHRLVILAWATGVWEGTPDLDTMQAALRGSLARLSHLKRPWCGATDAAATFVLTLLRLGWSAQSARHLTTHDGTKIDLLAVAPKTVGHWVDQASLLWSDSSAHWNHSKGPLFWEAIRPLLVSGKLEGWSLWHRNVLVKLVSRGIWTQERLARLRGEGDGSCQLCNDGPGTMFHRCYQCPALQTERDMYVSQEVRAAARAVGSQKREQFAHGIFRILAPFFPLVFLNASARFSGTIGQMGSWRGTFSRTAPRAATALCGGQAGRWRSTMWETSRSS